MDTGHSSRAIKTGVTKQLSNDEVARFASAHFACDRGQRHREPGHHRNHTDHGCNSYPTLPVSYKLVFRTWRSSARSACTNFNMAGADLLITDDRCPNTWTIQVKVTPEN